MEEPELTQENLHVFKRVIKEEEDLIEAFKKIKKFGSKMRGIVYESNSGEIETITLDHAIIATKQSLKDLKYKVKDFEENR